MDTDHPPNPSGGFSAPFFSGEELQELEEVAGPEFGRDEFGLGDLTPEFFFSPSKPMLLAPDVSLVWGVGPALQIPTATSDALGTGKWSAGPAFVTFLSAKPLHITTGFLVLNLWSFAGDSDRADVNSMTLQPFLNYNLPKGWYLTTAPVITANWEADGDNRWTVPLGGGVGRLFEIGHQPVNAQLSVPITTSSRLTTPGRIGNCALNSHSFFQNAERRVWDGAKSPLRHRLIPLSGIRIIKVTLRQWPATSSRPLR